MCGIVGYLGKKTNSKEIVKTLKKLEYRGYDSAGIAVMENGKIDCFKEVGPINNLMENLPEKLETNCAIAHTRWATHGKATVNNAHPHSSNNGTWSLVHNGIIENYLELKKNLKKISSDTDSAVVAELLEEMNVQTMADFIRIFSKIEGSYSIVAINKNRQNELFLAKNKSPLYVAESNGNYLVASDPICFAGVSKDYYEFNDGEFAHITSEGINFYFGLKQISKEKQLLQEGFETISDGGFKHFMLKEIFETPDAIARQVAYYKEHRVLDKFTENFLKKFNEIVFIGCGTAYHASLYGANVFKKQLGIRTSAQMASEFIYSKPLLVNKKMLFVFISQSGETADTLMAERIAREAGATTLALTNVMYSGLAKQTNYVIPVCAGPEIAVASTKAYVCQLTALYMLSSHLRNLVGDKIDYFKNILNISKKALNFDQKLTKKIAKEIKDEQTPIFIGKDLDYISAMESSLKLKEVSYINATNYASGELKHGFLALVENGTPLFAFCTQNDINAKTVNASHEAITRGARVVYITNDKNIAQKDLIFIDEQNELLASILAIIPMQYLSYNVSISKGINPDRPRNLAKSVTVE